MEKLFTERDYITELTRYKNFCSDKLTLDMSRGKPSKEQLDLSNGMLDMLSSTNSTKGIQDYRNYGILDGIPEAKKIFADLCGVAINEIMVLGNASLSIMYEFLQRALQFGVLNNAPLNSQGKIKWLCPVPGYDRHFAITELFNIEMINIPMTESGPDMDMVERLVQSDEAIKGIWCVPKYSNPQGIVYSDETVERFAKLQPKAKDFRIYWDNAYMIHYVTEDVPLKNLLNEAKKYNNEDIVYMFGSTSKITFAGAGVGFVMASEKNLISQRKYMSMQTIGFDKINQLAHYKFLQNTDNIYAHMAKHAALMKPKFDTVTTVLSEELSNIATWVNPKGGYFVSCELPEGTAKRTVSLAKEAGVVFTGAGATYPYKKDILDSNVRIAPSLPPVAELEVAMRVFCCCAKIACMEKIFNK